MKYIDIEKWHRKTHYEFFKDFDYPHFNITANVDISIIYPFIKKRNLGFFKVFLYAVMRTANSFPEFKYRIREDIVVEHNIVHPGFTVMADNDLYSNCAVDYHHNFEKFLKTLIIGMEQVKQNPALEIKELAGRDDLIYLSCLPWVSFTGVSHPINMNPVDSIPRIAWGKYFEEDKKLKMPLSVQLHHSLADGIHAGKYFMQLQELLDNPEELFES